MIARPLTQVSAFARSYICRMPPKLAQMSEQRWLHIANAKPGRGNGIYGADSSDEANLWIGRFGRPLMAYPLLLDLNASDEDIVAFARKQAEIFRQRAMFGMDALRMMELAGKQGWFDPQEKFARQLKKGWLPAISRRLQDELWWRRQVRREMCRKMEEMYRHGFNLINRRRQIYVSDDGVSRRRAQKRRTAAMMAAVNMINELGQEFTLAELVEKSNANPAIRRAELMTRISGFEYIARECGHIGEFITLTCPSRFHRSLHKSGAENPKYDGSNPRDGQNYLQTVWGRIQAALAREDINIYGFRVAEPHHDGTPHWHGLFFMAAEHRKAFRRIVARYGCRDSREELGLHYYETKTQAKAAAKLEQQRRRDVGEHVPSLAHLLSQPEFAAEADFWCNPSAKVFAGINARVDFEAINWKKGTAAGYIAKYIAKNIDGKNAHGDSIGFDGEDEAMSAVEAAERVNTWAATWGIRQFQQIGGPPVTVWRELRREGMATAECTEEASLIVRAAMAADRGDWGKFVVLMGGVSLPRKQRPVQLYKEDLAELNRYGEPRDKFTRGVFEAATGEIKISRLHEWTAVPQGGAAAAWTRVNNSTDLPMPQFPETASAVIKPENSKEVLRIFRRPTEAEKAAKKEELLAELNALEDNEDLDPRVKELEIRLLRDSLRDMDNLKSPALEEIANDIDRAAAEVAENRRQGEEAIRLRQYFADLDSIAPVVRRVRPQPAVDFSALKQRRRRFPPPKRHDTAESVQADFAALLAEVAYELEELMDWA